MCAIYGGDELFWCIRSSLCECYCTCIHELIHLLGLWLKSSLQLTGLLLCTCTPLPPTSQRVYIMLSGHSGWFIFTTCIHYVIRAFRMLSCFQLVYIVLTENSGCFIFTTCIHYVIRAFGMLHVFNLFTLCYQGIQGALFSQRVYISISS